MAVDLIEVGGTGRNFTNLKYIYFTPWVDNLSGGLKLGDTAYDLNAIVGDTTSVEQEDNETNEIPHEFSDSPLFETTTLGKKTFTTECVNFQNDVLKALFGWTVDENGSALAPATYKKLYVCIEMGFRDSDDVVVLPKVLMNSKAVLATMKTDVSRANITGTCYNAWVTNGASTGELKGECDMAIIAEDVVSTYKVAETSAGLSTGSAAHPVNS